MIIWVVLVRTASPRRPLYGFVEISFCFCWLILFESLLRRLNNDSHPRVSHLINIIKDFFKQLLFYWGNFVGKFHFTHIIKIFHSSSASPCQATYHCLASSYLLRKKKKHCRERWSAFKYTRYTLQLVIYWLFKLRSEMGSFRESGLICIILIAFIFPPKYDGVPNYIKTFQKFLFFAHIRTNLLYPCSGPKHIFRKYNIDVLRPSE